MKLTLSKFQILIYRRKIKYENSKSDTHLKKHQFDTEKTVLMFFITAGNGIHLEYIYLRKRYIDFRSRRAEGDPSR